MYLIKGADKDLNTAIVRRYMLSAYYNSQYGTKSRRPLKLSHDKSSASIKIVDLYKIRRPLTIRHYKAPDSKSKNHRPLEK